MEVPKTVAVLLLVASALAGKTHLSVNLPWDITLQRSGAKHILITSGFQSMHCMSGLEKRPLSGVHRCGTGIAEPHSPVNAVL